ncbi:MAG: metallophosphoesterase [Planctomycetota bacterium]
MTAPPPDNHAAGLGSPAAGHHTRAEASGAHAGPSAPRSAANPPPVPLPEPIEAFDLPHPDLPERLDGLTIVHITDTHVRTHPAPLRSKTQRRLPSVLAEVARTVCPDLVCFTGDAMDRPEDAGAALPALAELIESCAPGDGSTLGWFGVFGNHDSRAFQKRAAKLPGIRWLCNEHADLDHPTRGTVRLLGVSEPEDVFAAALGLPEIGTQTPPPFTITLAHFPPQVYPAARLGLPLVLAGHTHGGQIRLSPSNAPHTSCDFGSDVGSGLLRLGSTLCAISRGAGETVVDLRVNCPPQVGLYTLRRGPLPGGPDEHDPPRLRQVIPW